MEKEKPSYYAIIPANVRYDKLLTPNAKLLYTEITSLCNMNGNCTASSEYFSKLYNVSRVSIQKWLKQLEENNYIIRQVTHKKGSKEIDTRYITIVNYPSKEKLTDNNNTTYSNTNNNPIIPFEDSWKDSLDSRVHFIFQEFLKDRKERKIKNTERSVKLLINKLNKYDIETQIKMIEQSIENAYKGIFEVKSNNKNKSNNLNYKHNQLANATINFFNEEDIKKLK